MAILKDTYVNRPVYIICNVATSNVLPEFFCEDRVGKNLGIASAGAAGLN